MWVGARRGRRTSETDAECTRHRAQVRPAHCPGGRHAGLDRGGSRRVWKPALRPARIRVRSRRVWKPALRPARIRVRRGGYGNPPYGRRASECGEAGMETRPTAGAHPSAERRVWKPALRPARIRVRRGGHGNPPYDRRASETRRSAPRAGTVGDLRSSEGEGTGPEHRDTQECGGNARSSEGLQGKEG